MGANHLNWFDSGEFKTVFPSTLEPSFILFAEGASLLAFVLIMILFWWTFLSFQSMQSILSGRTIKYLCLISLLSFFFMSFISAMLLNDLVTQALSPKMCKVVYPLYFIFYNIGKICIYCLASARQQAIFNHNLYSSKHLAISRMQSNILKSIFILLPSLLWFGYIYLGINHIEVQHIPEVDNGGNDNADYRYCIVKTFDHVFYAQIMLALIGICDCIFRLITLTIFMRKAIGVTKYYKRDMNDKKRDIINKLSQLMRKTNLLDITSLISTLLFLICSAYIFHQILYFLIVDAVISSLCTIELFRFGDKLYKKTCFRCEKCCVCLYCLERRLGSNKPSLYNSKMEYQTFVDDMVNKNSVHLNEVDTPTNGTNNSNNILITTNGTNKTNNTNNTGNGILYESTRTSGLHTSSTLIQAGPAGLNGDGRKQSAITMLSGYEEIVPKDIDITHDRLPEERNTSLLSVSEFL